MSDIDYIVQRERDFEADYRLCVRQAEIDRRLTDIMLKVVEWHKMKAKIAASVKIKRYEWSGKKMVRVASILACLFAFPVSAAEYPAKYLSAYDGDSIRVEIDGRRETVRLAGVDTPEITGKCAAEKDLAIRAREFTRTWAQRSELILTTGKREREKYGRLLGELRNTEGESLGDKLIEAGLARKWTGRREAWC